MSTVSSKAGRPDAAGAAPLLPSIRYDDRRTAGSTGRAPHSAERRAARRRPAWQRRRAAPTAGCPQRRSRENGLRSGRNWPTDSRSCTGRNPLRSNGFWSPRNLDLRQVSNMCSTVNRPARRAARPDRHGRGAYPRTGRAGGRRRHLHLDGALYGAWLRAVARQTPAEACAPPGRCAPSCCRTRRRHWPRGRRGRSRRCRRVDRAGGGHLRVRGGRPVDGEPHAGVPAGPGPGPGRREGAASLRPGRHHVSPMLDGGFAISGTADETPAPQSSLPWTLPRH